MKLMRALIVDAEDSTRRQVARLLDECGFHSVEAKDGIEAIQFASENGVDLIVMEARLAGVDGPQFLDLVIEGAFGRKPPPLIMCAANLHEQVWAQKLGLPQVAVVAKPFTPGTFASALDAAFPPE